jgi:hypothetical protein
MSTFWMETLGDWGQELVYSPRLAHYSWDWMPFHTQTEPYMIPFAYAIYWTVHAWALLKLAQGLQRRYGWSLLKGVIVLSIPINFIWDLSVEATSAYFGWWTYDPGFGPVIQFARGRQPLLWPITLMVGWPNLMAYLAGKPTNRGLNMIERAFRLDRRTRVRPTAGADPGEATDMGVGRAEGARTATLTRPRAAVLEPMDYEIVGQHWRFELRRIVAWLIVFQVSFFLLLVVPLVVLRVVSGHGSVFVP